MKLDGRALRLGVDSSGRKTNAAMRLVPIVKPLDALLRDEYVRQGRPVGNELVCQPRHASASGLLSATGVMKRARRRWEELTLTPIGLHESRHAAASWLNAAGVNPKVASALMGHSTPERAAAAASGAAGITLSRYTHTLPGDLERAREQLDAYLDDSRQPQQAAPE